MSGSESAGGLGVEIVAAIRRDTPGINIGLLLSAFDTPPFRPEINARGMPDHYGGSYLICPSLDWATVISRNG